MQLAKQAKLGSIELRHRARHTPADIVGEIDVDVVEIDIHRRIRAAERLVEILRNDDDRRNALLAERALGVGGGHLFEEIRVAVCPDDPGHALRKPSVALDDEGDRLLPDRVREHRDQDPHAEGREKGGGDRRRRAQPDGEIVAGHPPDAADHRATPFDSRPSVSAAEARAIVRSTSRFR